MDPVDEARERLPMTGCQVEELRVWRQVKGFLRKSKEATVHRIQLHSDAVSFRGPMRFSHHNPPWLFPFRQFDDLVHHDSVRVKDLGIFLEDSTKQAQVVSSIGIHDDPEEIVSFFDGHNRGFLGR